jgi:hypothetical protein
MTKSGSLRLAALLSGAAICLAAAPASAKDMAGRCAALAGLKLPHGRVVEARLVAASSEAWPGQLARLPAVALPESCRVKLLLTPKSDSRIAGEVWLPTRSWNGRMQGVGNGGMGGSISVSGLMLGLAHDYAVTATDTGHEAPETDASWALGHPEKLADLGWRAIHETAVAGKRVIAAFYGKGPRFSYFSGGSNAGRAALIEAQRFPQDYDGIVAGAPSLDPANNLTTATWFEHRQRISPGSFIPESKAAMIAAAVTRACDANDGVTDGIVSDPLGCGFDPITLVCKAGDAPDCLTVPQARWLNDVYDGPGGDYRGHRNWGLARGGEAEWTPFWFGKAPETNLGAAFSPSFFRYAVYGDASWDYSRFDYAKDRAAAAESAAGSFDANQADLSRFKARGGKLILYQGWADPLVPPRIVIDYYDRVQAKMGARQAASFVRLYMAPGVGHVIGGHGPSVFGQLAPGRAGKPERSLNAAIEAWVERGQAPKQIIAGNYADDLKAQFLPGSEPALRERPLCPWPQVARWDGHGSIDQAASFTCVEPGSHR